MVADAHGQPVTPYNLSRPAPHRLCLVAVCGLLLQGGALSLAGAVHAHGGIDAAVPFYGTPKDELADVSTITVPVQGHFGVLDKAAGFSDPAAAAALEEKLKKAGVEHSVFLYEGVGHAFMNELESAIQRRSKLGQGEHDQPSVDLAFGRTVDFLKAKLA